MQMDSSFNFNSSITRPQTMEEQIIELIFFWHLGCEQPLEIIVNDNSKNRDTIRVNYFSIFIRLET